MQVQSRGWEYPLEEGMSTYSSILVWRINATGRRTWQAMVHRVAKSRTQLKGLSMQACTVPSSVITPALFFFKTALATFI